MCLKVADGNTPSLDCILGLKRKDFCINKQVFCILCCLSSEISEMKPNLLVLILFYCLADAASDSDGETATVTDENINSNTNNPKENDKSLLLQQIRGLETRLSLMQKLVQEKFAKSVADSVTCPVQ